MRRERPLDPGQEARQRRRVPRPLRGSRHRDPDRRRGRSGRIPRAARPDPRRIGRHVHLLEPLRRAADGGLGRHHRRPADRPRAAPLAALRIERLRTGVGRGDGRAPRRSGQPEPARARARRPSTSSPGSAGSWRPSRWPVCSSPTRVAGPVRTGRRCRGPPTSTRSSMVGSGPTRPRCSATTSSTSSSRTTSPRRCSPAGRVRLRRREALPRLPAARAADRLRPSGPLRR